MNQTKNTFDIYADKYLSFLDNEYVSSGLILFLILYASVIAPKLPSNITSYFKHPLIQLILFFIIVFLAKKDVSLALITAVAVLVTIMVVNYNCNKNQKENFDAFGFSDDNHHKKKKGPCIFGAFGNCNKDNEGFENSGIKGESEGHHVRPESIFTIYKDVFGHDINANGQGQNNLFKLFLYDCSDLTIEEFFNYIKELRHLRRELQFDFDKTLKDNIYTNIPNFKNSKNGVIVNNFLNKYGDMKLGNFITAHGREKIGDVFKLDKREINKYYIFASKMIDLSIEMNNMGMKIDRTMHNLPYLNSQIFFNNLDMTLNQIRMNNRKFDGIIENNHYLEILFSKYGNHTVALFLQNHGDKRIHELFENVEEGFEDMSHCDCDYSPIKIRPNRNRINNNMPFMSNTFHLDDRVNDIDAIDLEHDASNFMLDEHLYTDFKCNRM